MVEEVNCLANAVPVAQVLGTDLGAEVAGLCPVLVFIVVGLVLGFESKACP